jgi:hypothetical protein
LNRQPTNPYTAPSSDEPVDESPRYSFEYTPPHDQTPAQSGEQFAKIQKLLEKAVKVANGEPTE